MNESQLSPGDEILVAGAEVSLGIVALPAARRASTGSRPSLFPITHSHSTKGKRLMNTITTKDGTEIYFG